MKLKRYTAFVLSVLFILSTVLCGCDGGEQSTGIFQYKVDKGNLLFQKEKTSYSSYLLKHKKVPAATDTVLLDADKITAAYSGEYLIENEGKRYAFLDGNSKWVEWTLNIPKDSFYVLSLEYRTVAGDAEDMILSVSVDGASPYKEAENFNVPRRWVDDKPENGFDKDDFGNDIRPVKREVLSELSSVFTDTTGCYSDGFGLALTAGRHTIRLANVHNGVLVKTLQLCAERKLQSYKEYAASVSGKESEASEKIIIETEQVASSNTSAVYAVNDWIDVATTPNSAKYTRLNAIGDTNWNVNGQRLTWQFNVEKSGYYSIMLRARQDYSEGMNVYRSLYIDGEVPFAEAEQLEFPYDFEWRNTVAGGEKPYYFYLEKGEHTISLEVNTSAIADSLVALESLLEDLNMIYRKIIIITGTTVDIYQDYDLDTKIPNLVNSFKDVCNRMRKISAKIKKTNRTKGSVASILDEAAALLDVFIEHPYQISGKLDSYKAKVDDISSLITSMGQQSLLLDKIVLTPKGKRISADRVGIFKKAKFGLQKFVNSYFPEKEKGGKEKNVKVWVSTGRDQAQIIKQMISNSYNGGNMRIQLSIVDTGNTLIQATLAGRGPDVALSLPIETPINLSMRGALLNLCDFDVDKIHDDFYESAWTQLRYGDGIFGIPESQSFEMLFVRDDILKEIGLSGVPKTWDEFYHYMEVIQNNNLMVGIIETNGANIAVSGAISTFSKLYFQNGATYYNDDLSETTFDSDLAVNTMLKVCELYTRYGLDRQYDFFNRFRSGELVMAISNYTSYNQLVASAPEINGVWSMHPIPGTLKSDGTIDRKETSGGTASVILKAAETNGVAKEAYDFIRWWTGASAQSEFAERIEGVMGTAARYAPANKKAFDTIRWSDAEATALKQQWEQIYNVREIPGNYYIARSLTSAIRNTINGSNSIRFNMAKYNQDINSEIKRKRMEFGLE